MAQKDIPPSASEVPLSELQKPRYFIVSPYKTATTTVGTALMTLGAGRKEMTFRRGLVKTYSARFRELSRTITKETVARDWITENAAAAREVLKPAMPLLLGHDVFSDAPFGHGHVHCFLLKAGLPGARFIWIDRPRTEWIKSVRAWELGHPETYPNHTDWKDNPKERRRKLRGKRSRLQRNFMRTAEAYPEDCLWLDMQDLQSWDSLAAFCNLPAPQGAPVARNITRGNRKG